MWTINQVLRTYATLSIEKAEELVKSLTPKAAAASKGTSAAKKTTAKKKTSTWAAGRKKKGKTTTTRSKKAAATKQPAKKLKTKKKTATATAAAKSKARKKAKPKRTKAPLTEEQKLKAKIRALKAVALKEPSGPPTTAWTVLIAEAARGQNKPAPLGSVAKDIAQRYRDLSPEEMEVGYFVPTGF